MVCPVFGGVWSTAGAVKLFRGLRLHRGVEPAAPHRGIVYATEAKTGLWSMSGLDFNLANRAVQTSTWTGAATPLITPFGSRVFLLAGVGAATIGTASGYSVTGGALAEVPIKGKSTLLLGPTVIKSSVGATAVFFRIAWGFSVK